MNERIKELIKSCGIIPEDEHYEVAELIVEECIKQVEKNFAGAVGTYAGAHNSAVLKCKKSIQEHFGVEE